MRETKSLFMAMVLFSGSAWAEGNEQRISSLTLGLVDDIIDISVILFLAFVLAGLILFIRGLYEFYNSAKNGNNGSNGRAVVMILVGAAIFSSPLLIEQVRNSLFKSSPSTWSYEPEKFENKFVEQK